MKTQQITPDELSVRLRLLVRTMIETDSRLALVKGEKDDSTDPEPESASFLKLDGKRLGRDVELYEFMAKVCGAQTCIACVLEEIVLSLKDKCPQAFQSVMLQMYTFKIFGPMQEEWEALLDSLSQ